MRISVFVFVVAALAGCGAPPAGSVAAATAESEAGWRFAGGDAALVGRSSGIAFERPGPRPVTAKNTTVRIKAHCGGCPSPASFEFDAASPAVPYELDAGIAESIVASVVFPAEGIWNFEPLGGQITVREPTSTKPPVVVVRPWSVALTPDCGPKQIEDVFTRFAQAFNGGRLFIPISSMPPRSETTRSISRCTSSVKLLICRAPVVAIDGRSLARACPALTCFSSASTQT